MGFSDFTDDSLEQFETLGRTAKQQAKQAPKQIANTVKAQIKGSAAQNGNQQPPSAQPNSGYSDADKQQLLEQMYGSAKPKNNAGQNSNGQQPAGQQQSLTAMIIGEKEKMPDEQARLEKVRKELEQKLHYEMNYKQLDELGKAKQQETVEEQKEQVEKQEEQKKMFEQQEEKKKQEDLAVANARKGTGEQLKGVGG